MDRSEVFSRRAAGSVTGAANVDSTSGASGTVVRVAGDEQPRQSTSPIDPGRSCGRVLDEMGSLIIIGCRKALLADFRDAER
jgi:hypothetical protein